jgi:DNA-binding HxlR family transcriptional regulator
MVKSPSLVAFFKTIAHARREWAGHPDMNREGERNLGVQNFDTAYARRARLTIEVLLQGKWRIEILCAMRRGPVRLGQLARLIPDASKKMLTQNLRKLEADGIVIRSDLSDTLLHIEYGLKEGAREAVFRLLDELEQWGNSYLRKANTRIHF